MHRIELGPAFLDTADASSIIPFVKLLVERRKPAHIITLNSLMFNSAVDDPEGFAPVIRNAAFIVPDSIGIVWAAKFLAGVKLSRCPGIDMIFDICKASEESGYKIYLLGSAHGIAEKAADKLKTLYPHLRIAGTHHGYLVKEEQEQIIRQIRDSGADILFVGMSVPKQEKWISEHLEELGIPVVMGVGGSFDVISGFLKRAPLWMQRLGFEWLYRTIQQPWRFFRIMHLPIFVLNVVKLRLWNKDSTISS